jgi:RNA-binding protein
MNKTVAPVLSAAERKVLRGKAMNLKPALLVGRAGISKTVLEAAEFALLKDGLIKVRIEAPDRQTRKVWLVQLAEATASAICGEVGHTASLFRPKPVITP